MSRFFSTLMGPAALLVATCPTLRAAWADEPTGLSAARALESALIEAIAQTEKSVVAIARVSNDTALIETRADVFGQPRFQRAPTPEEPDFIPNDYATGVVVDAAGLILTANHVLRDGSSYYVTTNDRRVYMAKILAADPRGDLAVLKIEAKNLVPIHLGDASRLTKGQIVIALGNPYAIARDGQVSASWGIVSNLARKDGPLAPRNSGANGKPALHQNGTLIQTDAKLNLGTSGGALVNLAGEMVGLTVALSAMLGYEQPAGFAMPVDAAFKRALERLKEGREAEYGFLGVSIDNLALNDRARGRTGVGVVEANPGTPAELAGLRSGDVVTHVAGEEIFDSDQFMLAIGSLPAGDHVRLTWFRDGKSMSRNVELAKYPVVGNKIVTNPSPLWRGVRVDYVTAGPNYREWASQRRLNSLGCVLITEVDADSPAWREGLRAEMMVSHVGGRPVSTPREFHQVLADQTGPIELRLQMPNGEDFKRTIPPDAS